MSDAQPNTEETEGSAAQFFGPKFLENAVRLGYHGPGRVEPTDEEEERT